MSDDLRKPITTQIQEKVTPDSQKSSVDKAKEGTTGLLDRGADKAQPSDTKSTTQKAADATRGGKDDASNQGGSIIGSAQDTLKSATDSVSNALGGNNK